MGVFDLTSLTSFTNVTTIWYKSAKEKSENSIFYLVDNKKDLIDKRKVSEE